MRVPPGPTGTVQLGAGRLIRDGLDTGLLQATKRGLVTSTPTSASFLIRLPIRIREVFRDKCLRQARYQDHASPPELGDSRGFLDRGIALVVQATLDQGHRVEQH